MLRTFLPARPFVVGFLCRGAKALQFHRVACVSHQAAMESVLRAACTKELVTDRTPSIELFDLDYFNRRIDLLQHAFPESFFVHSAALKANSIRGILLTAKTRGLGAECASISEVLHALSLGFPARNIIFDSPCKSKYDLELALSNGVYVNADNDHELVYIDELLASTCKNTSSRIGLRINPIVGSGAIPIVSTATKQSKFGLPVANDTRDKVLALYDKYQWLSGIHVHVGSQGVPMELFVQGVKVCMDFVKLIEKSTMRKIHTVDIGGGLSTSYTHPEEPTEFTYELYRQRLSEEVPELFTGKYRVITEFGRSLFLKAGTTVTKIEYVKQWLPDVKPIALTHVGTNQFIRETYLPDVWRHTFSVAGPNGTIKKGGSKRTYDLAGPMCFQGDYLAKDVELPEVNDGDWLLIHDTGAYTMAMYSKFNSVLPSPVYGYWQESDGSVRFKCFKERETPEECLEFWGLKEPRDV